MTTISAGAGAKAYIGPTTAASDASDYAALSWTEIIGLGSIGDFGPTAAAITFEGLSDTHVTKAKGIRNAGTVQLSCAWNPQDPGQIAAIAAEQAKFAYAFKVTAEDSPDSNDTDSVWYFHALVMSAVVQPGAGPNAVMMLNITLDITGAITPVPSVAVS